MNRAVWFLICTLVGLELIAWGLLVPVHIRALDAKALEVMGAQGPSLAGEGLSLVNLEKTGPARMLLRLMQTNGAPGHEQLAAALRKVEQDQPRLRPWGGAALYLERIFERAPLTNTPSQPFVDLLIEPRTRETLLQALQHSRRPPVLQLLQARALTNTVIFPAAMSASGQPLDAALLTSALLLQQDEFATGLRNSVQTMVATATGGGSTEPLELFCMDVLALGKRLDWTQLVELVRTAPDTNAFQQAAMLFRENEESLPVIYGAIHFTESPMAVAQYLQYFPGTGLKDLNFALRAGGDAARQLVQKEQPVHYPTVRNRLVSWSPVRVVYEPLARFSTLHPLMGFIIKYGVCLLGALLVARALTYLSPSLMEEMLDNRLIVTGPQTVIGLCLLFTVLFFSESMSARATPPPRLPLHFKFPMASGALRAKIPQQARSMTNETNVTIPLLIFFVTQAVIYVFCRMKLAEIRRQPLPSRLKLRLLENEEHLFDAGLYFGFVGTVVSLIVVSMGIAKFGIMSAYASTCFGIVFVSIVKIFHVRPYRRRLIMDAEMAEQEAQVA
jgi:hypothetical protein